MGELGTFVQLFNDTLGFFSKRLVIVLLFVLPSILSFIVLMLIDFQTYSALGGVFIRYEDMQSVGYNGLFSSSLLMLVTTYFGALATAGIAMVAFNLRTNTKNPMIAIKNELFNVTNKLFVVKLFIYLIGVMVFVFARVSPLFHLINIALGVMLLFVPQALVIEESRTLTAIKHSVKFIKRNMLSTLLVCLLFLVLFLVQEVFLLVPDIYELATIIYTNTILIPIMDIFCTFLYLEKYQIAKRKTHM